MRTALLTQSPQIQKPPWTETTAAATGTARRGGEGVGAESLGWSGGGGERRATGRLSIAHCDLKSIRRRNGEGGRDAREPARSNGRGTGGPLN